MKQSQEDIINHVNEETTRKFLPLIIILCFIMLMGVIGNCLVVYIFKYKLPGTPSSLLVVYLGLNQIVDGLICVPMDIFLLSHSYNFPDDILCRFIQTFIFSSSTMSGLIIVAIAVDCFKKICRPLKRQFTKQDIHRIIVLIFVILILIVPAHMFVMGVREVRTFRGNVTGTNCSISDKNSPAVPLAYSVFLLLVFLVLIIVFIVIYTMAFKKLKTYNIKRKFLFGRLSRDNSSKEEFSESDKQYSASETSSQVRYRKNYYDITRITLNMFCITLSWCLSFLPHSTLTFLVAEIIFIRQFMAPSGNSLVNTSLNSYYVNTITIPILYIIFNPLFREETVKFFKKYVLCNRFNKPEE